MSIARLEPEVLGAAQVGAHLLRGSPSPVAEREARQPQPELHRRPSVAARGRAARRPRPRRRAPPGGVFRLRPIMTAPSIRTIEIARQVADARAPRARSRPTSRSGASHSTMSAARPGREHARRRGRGRARCCRSPSRRRPPARRRRARRGGPCTRRIPSGTTPVPDGASLPMITRRSPSSASPSPPARAIRTASIAARPLPQWTISIAMSVSTTRSMSASDIGVVPPLTWPTMCGRASSTASAAIGFEPAIDGPPVWNVTVIPCCFAQATIGAACAPVLTLPSPISPTSVTPPAAISAKSCSSSPSSRIGAPAVDLHAGGPEVRRRPWPPRSRAPSAR